MFGLWSCSSISSECHRKSSKSPGHTPYWSRNPHSTHCLWLDVEFHSLLGGLAHPTVIVGRWVKKNPGDLTMGFLWGQVVHLRISGVNCPTNTMNVGSSPPSTLHQAWFLTWGRWSKGEGKNLEDQPTNRKGLRNLVDYPMDKGLNYKVVPQVVSVQLVHKSHFTMVYRW